MTDLLIHTAVVSLAWFAGVNALVSVVVWVIVRRWRHVNEPTRPSVLLAIRLLPASASMLVVAAVLVPAQLALEPRDAGETLGWLWYAMAAIGAALLLRSVWRAVVVARASRMLTADCQAYMRDGAILHEVEVVAGISLAGIIKPRILIGRSVRSHLTGAELDIAIAHEVAHREAFDNLARWSMLCAPDFLAKSEVGSRLEHAWHVAAESLADATAARGDETRAVQLASALVKVARLAAVSGQRAPAPSWSTLNDSELLERRVERLLAGGAHTLPPSRLRFLGASALMALCVALPVFIPPIHRLTESLVALLP
jgi:beta-lactamase regulating signal transducer with metallopeptidase domain